MVVIVVAGERERERERERRVGRERRISRGVGEAQTRGEEQEGLLYNVVWEWFRSRGLRCRRQ
jgi:hypothetical protein